ncbi:MAG TPA: histidinol-phosphate transaminase [Candidatus Nanoarchaeia archaeon]|nr:histidinol-phosphate transaminase [Candidatus Nanoarchaeia archaeon]
MTNINPRKAVLEMDEYRPPIEGRRGFLRLDFNENTIGCSPKVLSAINKIKEEEIAAYPEYIKFKEKLAKYLKIKPEQLMVSNATDEAIMVLMQTYIEQGDEVIIPVPTFAMFKFYAQLAGAKVREIPYTANLAFPTKKVLDAATKKTKLIILCNPNNPTGTLIDKKDIIRIIEKARSKDCLVLLDEAYHQYSGAEYLDLIPKYDNLIIIRTFSKAYGMGGIRLGYAASNEDVMKNLLKAQSPYSVNSIAVAAGSKAIEDKAYVDWYVGEVKKAREILYNALKKLKIKSFPTAANFLIVKLPGKAKEIELELKQKGILVRNRSKDPLLNDCIRIGIGTVKQTEQFITALKEALK